ncbi:MAG TPA: alanine--glyoxylate aminotransferase family protein [Gaiellales bacterium]
MTDSPFLLTPGPVPVPPAVLAIMDTPQQHHRSKLFVETYGEVLRKLQLVFRTEHDVLLFTASGTGAFESVFANTIEAGDRVLCVTAGAFGNRWVSMAQAFGAEVVKLEGTWGRPPEPQAVADAMADETLKLAVVVHSETSTATVADIQRIGELSRGRTCLLAIDAVSSLGAMPIETDAWGLDLVVSGTQKGMSSPPGLSFASISPAAWARSRETTTPRFYFDWKRTLDAQNGGGSPFTPATATVNALDVALDLVLEEGLEAIWARTQALAGRFRARVLAAGLGLYSPDDPSCSLVTAVAVPEGADADELRRAVLRAGFIIEGGRGQTAGKVLRFGHLGATDEDQLNAGFDALLAALPR